MLGLSAYWKIALPGSFLEAVVEYRLVPFPVALVVASWLPWLEALVGLALLTRWHRGAGVVAVILAVLFITAQTSVLARGLSVPCGCFGPTTESVGPASLIRSTLFLILACITIVSRDAPSPADKSM